MVTVYRIDIVTLSVWTRACHTDYCNMIHIIGILNTSFRNNLICEKAKGSVRIRIAKSR